MDDLAQLKTIAETTLKYADRLAYFDYLSLTRAHCAHFEQPTPPLKPP